MCSFGLFILGRCRAGVAKGLIIFFLVREWLSGRIRRHCIAAAGIVNIQKRTRQEPHGLTSKEAGAWIVLKHPPPPLQTDCGSGTSPSFPNQPFSGRRCQLRALQTVNTAWAAPAPQRCSHTSAFPPKQLLCLPSQERGGNNIPEELQLWDQSRKLYPGSKLCQQHPPCSAPSSANAVELRGKKWCFAHRQRRPLAACLLQLWTQLLERVCAHSVGSSLAI